MQPTDWGQAFSIVGGGLMATFLIMGLLALITHFMGKFFISQENKKQARADKEAA